jgi:hypothetical protein
LNEDKKIRRLGMAAGTSGLGRRSSNAEIGGKPIPAETIKQGETPSGGGGSDALDFRASKPVTVSKECLPLAPFQCVTFYDKRRTAEFLTFTEAISLMLASKDMHLAIKDDPLLRLDEISLSFHALGCHQLVESTQTIEAQISELQRQAGPGAVMAGTPADLAKRSISFAGLSFRIRRSPKALRAKEAEVQAAKEAEVEARVREKTAEKAQLAARLESLERAFEDVVFHFASEHMNGPPRAPGAIAQAYAPPEKIADSLRDAIDKGDVKLARVGLHGLLSISKRLMPNARKVVWLRELFKLFSQNRCGNFKELERRQYDSLIACVDEIVSSKFLSYSEKAEFCHQLERLERDGRVLERDIFGYALFHNNPAVAAAILLGIHESSAEPDLKQSLLAAIAASWGGLDKCVDYVNDSLLPYSYRAPNWFHEGKSVKCVNEANEAIEVNGIIPRLKEVKMTSPMPAEKQGGEPDG